MTIALIALFSVTGAVAGRMALRGWFNHVVLYSLVWGTSLVFFEIRLIEYYPLSIETWVFIFGAWFSFVIGSLIAIRPDAPGAEVTGDIRRPMRFILLGLSGLALVAVLSHWAALIARFGSIANVLVFGNVVYSLRLSGDLGVGIPYLDSLAIAGCLFGGIYHALEDRLRVVAILPLAVVILESIAGMGRAKLLIGILLYLSAYFLTRRRRGIIGIPQASSHIRRWFGIAVALALVAVGAETVRSTRGMVESFEGSTRALSSLRGGSFITPSIYMYLTIHHGVFNQYLKDNSPVRIDGAYLLAPMYRVLAKVGFDTRIPDYDKFYRTPTSANTGTYLHQVHHDFGAAGILIIPFCIGLLCTRVRSRFLSTGGYAALALLGHLYAAVGISYFVGASRLGYWLVSLLASVTLGAYLDMRRRRPAAR